MRKLFCIILGVLILFAISAFAEEDSVGIVNLWREVTSEEMFEEIGIAFTLPEDAKAVCYSMIADEKMAQVEFTMPDYDIIFTARMKPAVEYEDISGLYYDWDVIEECDICGCQGETMRAFGDEETVDLCMWYEVISGMMYSVTVSDTDLDGFDITAIAMRMYTPLQGND